MLAGEREDLIFAGERSYFREQTDCPGEDSFSPLSKNRAGGLSHELKHREMVFGSFLSPLELTFRKGTLPSYDIS